MSENFNYTLEQFERDREVAEEKFESNRRFLHPGEDPTLPFVVEFGDGRMAEAATPIHLMDLIVSPYYSDTDEEETFIIQNLAFLREVAVELASKQTRATVYSALGPFYDSMVSRHQDEIDQESENAFENAEDPIILDGYDAWTVIASLVKAGYLKLYEKLPVWTGSAPRKQSCEGCVFNRTLEGGLRFCEVWGTGEFTGWDRSCAFSAHGTPYLHYVEVTAEELSDPSYKREWKPIAERAEEYIGFRPQSHDPSDE